MIEVTKMFKCRGGPLTIRRSPLVGNHIIVWSNEENFSTAFYEGWLVLMAIRFFYFVCGRK
jgi:hypothetical protein